MGSAVSERVAWRCRRGMLELDLLLRAFLERGYHELSPEEQRDFERLLRLPDPQLFNYLMGHEAPEERDLADVVTRIRQTAAP